MAMATRRSSAAVLRALARSIKNDGRQGSAELRNGFAALAMPALDLPMTTSSAASLTPAPSPFTVSRSGGQRRGFASSIIYPPSEARIGQKAPDFKATAVAEGEIKDVSLADYKGKYVILFFYPKDFTFVCPTEIIAFSDRAAEFDALNCQLIAASTDTAEVHMAWIKTPRRKGGLGAMQIPILADVTKEISARYGVLLPEVGVALRGLFIINPEGVLEQMTVNNLSVGRNVDEALRLLQAVHFVAEHGEVCPADWKPGGKTMVAHHEKSQDYFGSLEDKEEESDDFGTKIHSVKSADEFRQLVDSGKPVVADFYAPWCGKCRMIAPLVEELQDKHPGVTFVKVDKTNEALGPLTEELGITALPAFHFYKGGKEAMKPVIGYKRKPLQDMVTKLAGN